MKFLQLLSFSLFLFCASLIPAQKQLVDSTEFAHFDCGITQTKQKLDGRFYASTPSQELRVNNEEFIYTTLQFGKRKKNIYMYLRILEDNICIKKEKNVDIYFKTGEVITFKNEYPINCESFFAKQLKKKEIKKILENEITQMKIYTYKKNFELYINTAQNTDIQHYLSCLIAYKIKKTDEVKLKKKKKDQQPTTDNPQPKEK